MQKLNKKANMDSPTIGIGIFMIGIALIVAALIISTGLTAFSGTTGSTDLLDKSQQMFLNMGNTGFMFIVIALIVFNIFASFFLPTHPIFVVIDIVFIPISIWVAAIISNAWESTMATMAATAGFTVMNYVMANLVMIIVCTDIITAIVSYAIIKNAYG